MNNSKLITYYAGFDSHLKFDLNKNNLEQSNSTLRPLDNLVLEEIDNEIEIRNGYLGWCSLFLLTERSEIYNLSYNSVCKIEVTKTNCKLFNPFDLKSLECNNKETYLVCHDRKVKCWPSNDFSKEPITVNSLMDEGKIKVKQLSVGSSFVCALLETGLVKAIDEEGSSVKFELEADLDEFEYVACGHEHVLLLTKKGSVYSYGMGSRGQLGHGNLEDVTEDCKLIEALEGIKIIQISAGSWHSLALSEFGDVYSWGLNESGQLGVDVKNNGVLDIPSLVNLPKSLSFINVSCGSRHSMAISQEGNLWVWGWNKYNQLGIDNNDLKEIKVPRKLDINGKVVSIKCKFWSSLIQIYYS